MVWMLPLHVCVLLSVCRACKVQKGVLDPLELKLQMILRHCVGACSFSCETGDESILATLCCLCRFVQAQETAQGSSRAPDGSAH